jgi:hypothetical protein
VGAGTILAPLAILLPRPQMGLFIGLELEEIELIL